MVGGSDFLFNTADYLMSKSIGFIIATNRRYFINLSISHKILGLGNYLDNHEVLYSIGEDINKIDESFEGIVQSEELSG